MAKATITGGKLVPIGDGSTGCYIVIGGASGGFIPLNNLPEISDQKGASYNDEVIMGRSFPMKTYSHSENRAISFGVKFFVVNKEDVDLNISYMRMLESAVYPRSDQAGQAPFVPPPICRIRCGKLLGDDELCVVLRSYSVKFPSDVVWDEDTFLPMRIDLDLSFETVYRTSDLPGQEKIFMSGN